MGTDAVVQSKTYQRIRDFRDCAVVVFPCGWIVKDDAVNMYYEAADSCIAIATVKLSELVGFVLSCPNHDARDWWKG